MGRRTNDRTRLRTRIADVLQTNPIHPTRQLTGAPKATPPAPSSGWSPGAGPTHFLYAPHVSRSVTRQSQKVQCQHCDAHVTEQRPDWPGVWTEAGGYSSPVCAVVGFGCDDAQAYDLIDCVYPHLPAGEDSPAAAAIAAAQKAGYFFQP